MDLYRKNYSLYSNFTNGMQEYITDLLTKNGIRVQAIVSRVKEETSLQNKINKHPQKYNYIEEVTDLCGLRIITYFEDDVDLIAALLRQTVNVDTVNSVDKRKVLPATQFGYSALHMVVSLTGRQLTQAKYSGFQNCKIEIQICTILQHAWAEIEHDLGYKPQQPVSYEVRRSFSRIAGLLEIADTEFKNLRDSLRPPRLPLPTPAFVPVLSKQIAQVILPATVVKPAFLGLLSAWITEHAELIPLIKISEYAFLGILLLALTNHLAPATHLFSPFLNFLKAEKSSFFVFINSYAHV